MRLIDADLMFKCETCRHHRNGKCNTYCDHGEEYSPNLRAIPTIDPEELRPKGRWKTANDGTHFCPHCGWDAPYTWDDIDRNFINSADDVPDRPTNYCPNCGAKMEAVSDD